MKKLILIAAVAFTACGSPKTEGTSSDSTHVDSTKVDTTILKTVK